MFELEAKILEWRKKMLAAGIKSPVPLDELESHLRERVSDLKTGLSEADAFQTAAKELGDGKILRKEFSKGKILWRLRNNRFALNILAGWFVLMGLRSLFNWLRALYRSFDFWPVFHFYGASWLLHPFVWIMILFGFLHLFIASGLLRRRNGWRIAALILSLYNLYFDTAALYLVVAGDYYHSWARMGSYPYVAFEFFWMRLPIAFMPVFQIVNLSMSVWAIWFLTRKATLNRFHRATAS